MPPENLCPRPPRPVSPGLPAALTPAEERVLPFLCAGWSDSEIALDLHLPEDRVRQDVASCLQKFGAASRARLAASLLRGEFAG